MFDEFEQVKVFCCFEDFGIIVEYFNLLFLVKKFLGGYCFVIVFVDVVWYSKFQLFFMLDVNIILCIIIFWCYLIKIDFIQVFYQILFFQFFLKYCGVVIFF